MSQTSLLIEKLKRAIKSRGMTYAQIAKKLGVSEPTIKRVFSHGDMTMTRFEEVCLAAGIQIADLIKSTDDDLVNPHHLNLEQEEILALDDDLLKVFHYLSKGWSSAKIKEHLGMDQKLYSQLLLKLDRVDLIELHANDHIRLKKGSFVQWTTKGPLAQKYGRALALEFTNHSFTDPGEFMWFLPTPISPELSSMIEKKLRDTSETIAEWVTLETRDRKPSPVKQEEAIFIGFRKWNAFSWLKHATKIPRPRFESLVVLADFYEACIIAQTEP